MGFVNRNLVAIVTIPGIIGLHYGWSALQDNPKLVPEGTRIDQPIYSIITKSWAYVQTKVSGSADGAKAE